MADHVNNHDDVNVNERNDMTGFEKGNVHDNKIDNDHVYIIVNVNNHNIINDCERVLDFENNPMNEVIKWDMQTAAKRLNN